MRQILREAINPAGKPSSRSTASANGTDQAQGSARQEKPQACQGLWALAPRQRYFNVLERNQREIAVVRSRPLKIQVADLITDTRQERGGDKGQGGSATHVKSSPTRIGNVVVELIGGYGIAKALVLEAIAAGKHVVTANKALLAVHGSEIFKAAADKGVMVAYEAAVAGGIPIIKGPDSEGLIANSIQWVAGIINGTTNFILSEMRDKGLDFDVVLKEAQRLGYAEADPTFDIEGVDAAHKQTLIARLPSAIPCVRQGLREASPSWPVPISAKTPSNWATASSCWAITKRHGHKGTSLPCASSLVPSKRLKANVFLERRDERRGGERRWPVEHHAVSTHGAGSRAHRFARGGRPGGYRPMTAPIPAHRVPCLGLPAQQPWLRRQRAARCWPMAECREATTAAHSAWLTKSAGVLAKITVLPGRCRLSIDARCCSAKPTKWDGEGSTQTDLNHPSRHDTPAKGTWTKAAGRNSRALPTVLAPITPHPQGRAELRT
ncbi:hypothetical protein FQR65_LT20545 [Abscondita terminalis]|nr:hypothetical protein FQR65_LT20545 [Abscondita terminalis]